MCMTLIAGKAASKTGHVLVGHNEDDYVHASVRHHLMPATQWEPGVCLPAEPGNVRIPQTEHTPAYWWMQVRGPEGGLSTADSFLNEYGVCVVSDSSCGSREDGRADKPCESGIVYELRRAIAERAVSARRGLQVAIELIETYGYASPGRMYTIADKDEAFLIQVIRGHRYLAARVPDDALVILPNHYTFHSFSDSEEMFYPADLAEHAVRMGWYVPKDPDDDSDFDFEAAYQAPANHLNPENTYRQYYATQLLLGYPVEGYPFCVKAEHPVGIEDIMEALSTHYEGTEHDVRTGPGSSPHFTPVRRVCTGTTVESAVYELGNDPVRTCVWIAFGRPCELPYLPLHPLCGAITALETQSDARKEAREHLEARPGATGHRTDGWQRFQDFENALDLRYTDLYAGIKELKKRLHAEFLNREAETRTLSVRKINETDNRTVELALQVLPDVLNASILSVSRKDPCTVIVTFTCPAAPEPDTLVFGPGRLLPDRDFRKAQALSRNADSSWTAEFSFSEQLLKGAGKGDYEFYLAAPGFAAMTILHLD